MLHYRNRNPRIPILTLDHALPTRGPHRLERHFKQNDITVDKCAATGAPRMCPRTYGTQRKYTDKKNSERSACESWRMSFHKTRSNWQRL